MGHISEVEDFRQWLLQQPTQKIIVVPGNHDWCTLHHEREVRELFSSVDITYLRDEETIVEGRIIYGSPWTPKFFDWAWMLNRGPDIMAMWKKIPKNTNILVTHGPPAGKLDWSIYSKEHVGCYDLRTVVEKIKPEYHLFGHIHHDYGMARNEHTVFVNASNCNENYKLDNEPILLEI